MTPSEIMRGLSEKNRALTYKNDEYLDLIEKRAQAERAYSKALSIAMVEEKIKGQSITLIRDIVKGSVADLKYELDVADGVMQACKNAIKALTIQIDSYRSLLAWQKAELLRTE